MRYIRVRLLANDILMALGETYARQHSDVEILRAINHVATYVNMTLVHMESPYVQKEVKVQAKKRGVELPDDFIQISHFASDEDSDLTDDDTSILNAGTNKFRIRGNKIYTSVTDTMVYYYHIPAVYTMDDILELPYFLYLMMIHLVTSYINGELPEDKMSQVVSSEVSSVMANSVTLDRELPFYV